MRFRLRSAFELILVITVLLSIGRFAGYGVAAVIVAALLSMLWAVTPRARKTKPYIRVGVVVLAIGTLWFAAVDWSWSLGQCPDCQLWRHLSHYRILSVPIDSSIKEDGSLLAAAAHDLGIPCAHANLTLWQKERWWGLLHCRCPCFQGTVGLADDMRRYTPEVSARMKAIAAGDRAAVEAIRDRVLIGHDFNYFYRFFDEVAGQQQ